MRVEAVERAECNQPLWLGNDTRLLDDPRGPVVYGVPYLERGKLVCNVDAHLPGTIFLRHPHAGDETLSIRSC